MRNRRYFGLLLAAFALCISVTGCWKKDKPADEKPASDQMDSGSDDDAAGDEAEEHTEE